MRVTYAFFSAISLLFATTAALADPPHWAPAHGYRDKHDFSDSHDEGRDRNDDDDDHDRGRKRGKHRTEHQSFYVGYSGTEYDRDFDIRSGRCDREKVGAVLGGVAGGVVGNEVGNRDNRVVATILGAAVGALIGAKIGRDMDERDRSCVGHALELGTGGRRVRWTNRDSGVRYALIPLEGAQNGTGVCRDFRLTAARGDVVDTQEGRACQVRPGAWELAAR